LFIPFLGFFFFFFFVKFEYVLHITDDKHAIPMVDV